MAKQVDDLWPEELNFDSVEVRPPLLLLREQAELLSSRTSYHVEGRVDALPGDEENLILRFLLVVPALKGYRVELLWVDQPARLYPVTVHFNEEKFVAASEDELKTHLRTVFASGTCKRILGGLVAQAKI